MRKNFRPFSILFLLMALQFNIYAMDPCTSKEKGKASEEQIAVWETEERGNSYSQISVGPLVILQSAEIRTFLKSIGCDIEELWDYCIDSIPQAQQSLILEEKKFPDQFIAKLSKIAEHVIQAFELYYPKIEALIDAEPIEGLGASEQLITSTNLIPFLKNHKLKNSATGSLKIEISAIVSLDQELKSIRVNETYVEDIFEAIRASILSYFDIQSLSARLKQGDPVIFDMPETPIFIQCYEDGSIRVMGLPQSRQNTMFTEEEQYFQDDSTTAKQKFLSLLFCISELAAVATMPSYQATIAAMQSKDQQKSWATDLQKMDLSGLQASEMIDAYMMLGLAPGAGSDAIKQRYRELVAIWHPDKHPSDRGAKFIKISQAYEFLSK